MSFVKTLATLAVGFAAAKGVSKMRAMGGMDGVREAMRKSGSEGGMADQMGKMAEQFGVPGGAETVRNMMSKFGNQAADMSEATEAGLGSLMSAMGTAATAGAGGLSEMFAAVTKDTPVGEAAEDNAKLMISAMIMAAKSDGEIDAEERTKILDHLTDASDEEIAFVQEQLDAPVDPMALANSAGERAKVQVYTAASWRSLWIRMQKKHSSPHWQRGLGLDSVKVAEIHVSMGKPVL